MLVYCNNLTTATNNCKLADFFGSCGLKVRGHTFNPDEISALEEGPEPYLYSKCASGDRKIHMLLKHCIF